MDSMIERVSKALWDEKFRHLSAEDCRSLARAAIAAMREPTKAMTLDGFSQLPPYDPLPADAADCWQRMIDTALKEGE